MSDWNHAEQGDYEQYLLRQQAEQSPRHNDMTLDERMTEYIEWQNSDFDRDIMVDAHLEIFRLRAENARLNVALVGTAAQLVDAVQRAQEAEATCREIAEVSGETRIWQIATSAIMNATAAK